MKKIFLFILLFICLKGFGQYPSKQTLGSPTSKLEVLGGVHAVKGLINGRYADTTAANLGYIDSYHGSQIFTTTDKILWLRDSVLNKWVQVGVSSSSTNTSIGSAGFKVAVDGTNNIKRIKIWQGLSGDSLTTGEVALMLGQTVGQSGNPALLAANREIPVTGLTMGVSVKDVNTAYYSKIDAAAIRVSGPLGGGIISYIQPGAGSAFPTLGTYEKGVFGSSTTLVATGVHWIGTAGGNKHHYITDMRDSIQYAAIETAGTHMAAFGTVWNGHHTDLGAKGKVSIGSTGFLDHAGNKGYLDNYKSTYLRDSLMLEKRWVVTDSTGFDILVRSRTSPYETKQLSVPSLDALIGGGGGSQGLQDVITVDPIIAINSTISLAADLFIGDNIGVDFKNSTSTLELFGPTIKLNRGWSGAAGTPGLPAGTSTDSVVTINQADGQVRMRAASSFSGSGEINTASNLGGGLANYSTKVGVDLQFNSFFATDFDLGSNLISIDYANGQKASNTVSGFVSATTQTFSPGKTFNAPLNVKDAGGAYLQGFQIINSASVAQTSILHEGGSFFIGLATAASGADASGDFIQRFRAYEETATGTNPIIELGDNDLRINHDGTANYAGNFGIATAVPTEKLHVTGNIKATGTGAFGGDVTVPDEVYGSGWNGSLEVPTKNALWDKIETIAGSVGGVLYRTAPLYNVNDSTLGVDSTLMKIWPGSIIAGATMSLGSDADNDMYFRNGTVLARIAYGTTGQYMKATTGSDPSWGGVALNHLIAATATNSINNADFSQTWQWNSLTADGALNLTSSSTAATGNNNTVLYVGTTGTNANASQSTFAAQFTNNKNGGAGGTSIGMVALANTSSGINIGGQFAAISGTNNYAIIVPAASGRVGFGTSAPVASALLEMSSTTQGFLKPRMTTTQRDAISSPATGLEIYNTTTSVPNFWNGSAWTAAGGGGSGDALVANPLSQFAATTSAQLAGVLSNETGTGVAVFGTSPDFTTAITLGGVAVPTISSTNTFTNKRWTARVGSTTSSATPTINTDVTDIYKLTAQSEAITSFTTNLSGTPVDGDILEIQITGTAARALTFGASFVSSTVTIPTTTVTTATLTVIFQWFTTSSYGANKWVCVNSF